MYSQSDIVVRAIGGGIWFFMSLWLTVAFWYYIVAHRPVYKQDAVTTIVAVMLATFCFGSTIRAFLTWMQFYYAFNNKNVTYWVETWPWLGASILLNIFGAAGCIWLLSPVRWRDMYTLFAVSTAVLIPLGLLLFSAVSR